MVTKLSLPREAVLIIARKIFMTHLSIYPDVSSRYQWLMLSTRSVIVSSCVHCPFADSPWKRVHPLASPTTTMPMLPLQVIALVAITMIQYEMFDRIPACKSDSLHGVVGNQEYRWWSAHITFQHLYGTRMQV